jgi:hypothetical protein
MLLGIARTGGTTRRAGVVAEHGEELGDAAPRGNPVGLIRPLALGLGAGIGYGLCLRLWMRLVSTDPAFTWTGTAYIVGAFAVLGAMAGLATGLRRRRSRRPLLAVRTTGIVLSLGCFVAAGAAMFPTVVPAGLGLARTDWPRRLRAALVVVGAVAAVAVVVSMTELSWIRRAVALVLYLLLSSVEVAMVARLYAPSLPRGSLGPRIGVALALAVLVLVGAGVLLVTGLLGAG